MPAATTRVDVRICQGCGEKIPAARIKAVPTTMVCKPCAEYLEHYYKIKPTSGFDPSVIPEGDYAELRAIHDAGDRGG